MRWTKIGTVGVVSLLIVTAAAAGQNTAKTPEPTKPLVPLKVNVVFSEYEGAKKVSSLPYVLSVNANDHFFRARASLRMGIRVPISVVGNGLQYQYQYQDVGTNIDCMARSLDGGAYEIELSLARSSVYSPRGISYRGEVRELSGGSTPTTTPGSNQKSASESNVSHPIFSQFSADLNLVMHDGQTIQSTMATDPVSGRVLKVDATLHVVK